MKYKWVIELVVDKDLVDEGFNLTEGRAQQIFEHAFPWARMSGIKATVPDAKIPVYEPHDATADSDPAVTEAVERIWNMRHKETSK